MRKTARSMVVVMLAAVGIVSLLGTQPAGAAFPGEDGRIAFNNNGEVWTMNPDGSDRTNLTPGPGGGGRYPDWSADGTKIAFMRSVDIPAFFNEEIFTMNADGSGARRLTDNEAWDTGPVWSPDGARIAFMRLRSEEEGWDIWVMNSDGSGQRRLTSTTEDDHDPAWSPDGKKIAFTSSRSGNADVWRMGASDGSNQVNVTDYPADDEEPSWQPLL